VFVTPGGEIAYRLRAAIRKPASWYQLLKFGIVGGSGYVLNLVVFAAVTGIGAHHVPAAVAAFCVAVTNNFLWNRHWTFQAADGHPGFQAARFLTVSVAALLINLAILEALIAEAHMASIAAQAIAVAVAMPFNFLGNKLWTFAD
jgi:dolichol-phosphate mannosyltransferase